MCMVFATTEYDNRGLGHSRGLIPQRGTSFAWLTGNLADKFRIEVALANQRFLRLVCLLRAS